MAKVRVHVTAEEEIVEEFKVIVERFQWSFTTATELALKQFVARYKGVTIPGLDTPAETPEMEKAA